LAEPIETAMIVVDKTARTLSLVENGHTIATFPVLVGQNPGTKRCEGDMKTPEGRYFVLRLLPDEAAVGTGYYKGLHISYPEIKDAEAGFAEGRIDEALYMQILRDYQEGTIPAQESSLGGYVAIHAGLAEDEKFERGTKGCVVLRNTDMDQLYDFARAGMPIFVRP
jgi:L,D-transpeptidase catalytic domain